VSPFSRNKLALVNRIIVGFFFDKLLTLKAERSANTMSPKRSSSMPIASRLSLMVALLSSEKSEVKSCPLTPRTCPIVLKS